MFCPTGPSSVQDLLQLAYEPILVRMEQGSDMLVAHFCLCLEFLEDRFEVVDFRCVPLGPYLVLQLDFLLALRFLRVIVLEVANFILQGLLCLFGQYALTVKLVLKPPLLLLLVFPHFQDFPLRLSFGVEALVESLTSPLVSGGLVLELVLHFF